MTNTMDVMTKIVTLLNPLSSEERQRAVGAALMVLGEAPIAPARKEEESVNHNLPQRAQLWAKQNQLEPDVIEQVFHITGSDVDVIAPDIPGKNGKEKTLNAYILLGVAKLLSGAEPLFDDKSARALCKNSGFYSEANHAPYLKDKGNEFTGTKEKGWTLTAPGLKRGAALVKEIATSAS